jgi:hypothetical protein
MEENILRLLCRSSYLNGCHQFILLTWFGAEPRLDIALYLTIKAVKRFDANLIAITSAPSFGYLSLAGLLYH